MLGRITVDVLDVGQLIFQLVPLTDALVHAHRTPCLLLLVVCGGGGVSHHVAGRLQVQPGLFLWTGINAVARARELFGTGPMHSPRVHRRYGMALIGHWWFIFPSATASTTACAAHSWAAH